LEASIRSLLEMQAAVARSNNAQQRETHEEKKTQETIEPEEESTPGTSTNYDERRPN
jgi:hypothetical protein